MEQYFTNEIVGLLKSRKPKTIQQLMDKYPSFQSYLKEGVIMGGTTKSIDYSELDFRMELCIEGLNLAIEESDKLIPKIRTQLIRLKNIQLISQIVITISGASIITTLGKENKTIALIAGILTILSALLTIYIQYQSTGIGEKSQNISNAFTQLVEKKQLAKRQLQEIKIFSKFKNEERKEEIRKIINEANTLCEEVRTLIAYVK